MASRLTRSPTVQTLLAFLAVFLVSYPLKLFAPAIFAFLFTLSTPVTLQPWSVVTSVYSHANVLHLVSNAVALVVVGIPLERATKTWAFHAFFVATGALAGLSQVYATGLLGAVGVGPGEVAVLGASGAVFAIAGYVLAGNRLAAGVLDRLGIPAEWQIAAFAVVALVVTWATASPGVALVAHFTGLLLGLVAGRAGLLPSDRSTPRRRRDPAEPGR